MSMGKKLLLKFLLSLGIAAFFLWLTIDSLVTEAGTTAGRPFWDSLSQSLAAVPLGTLGLYVLLFLVVHVLRVYRWQFLIQPLGERDRGKIFRICAIGFSAIVILPLRLGEMVRPYLLSRESSVPMSAALGTAVVERVIDGLLITGLLFVCLAAYGGGTSTAFVTGTAMVALGLFSGALITLVLAAARPDLLGRLMQATLGRLSQPLTNGVLKLVYSFLDGVRVLRREGVLPAFLATTVAYWGLNGAGIMVLAHGFGFEVTLGQSYALLSIVVLGIMIPAGPGFFGNYQFFMNQGLLLFFTTSAVASAGLAFGLTLNVVQFIIQVGFGVPFFLAANLGLKKLVRAGLAPPPASAETQG
jgi:glycosyltransferase 2 family protein